MQFDYIARTRTGEIVSGKISASSQEEAVASLQAQDLIVLNCTSAHHLPFWLRDISFLRKKVSYKELVIFSRQLSTLISAKVPLVTALRALAKQQDNRFFQKVIFRISQDVEGGLLLSRALAKFPEVFSSFYINLIKSGEVSGNLENTLSYLAEHSEKNYYLFSRARNAMVYPAFILTGFVIVFVLMLVYVLPNLTAILEETGQELPLTTRIVIGLSHFVQKWWWLILISIIFFAIFVWQYKKTSQGRKFFDSLKLKIPIFGKVFQKIYLARLAENLGTLIKSGLPILQSLKVTSEVVGNAVFSELIIEAQEEVRVGNTISSVFEKHKEIPPMVTQMIFTGEKTGQLEFVLNRISNFYTQEVDSLINNLSSLIEPVLIIILGIGVVILLTAVLMPIYNIAGVI